MSTRYKAISECPVLVLAGGLGERLRERYNAGPKVLAPVGARAFLEYLLLWLRESGIKRIILCVGYKGEQLKEWLCDGRTFGLEVGYSSEEIPLGTAGALKKAEELVEAESFFAMNGDSFLDVDLSAMYLYHMSHSAVGTLALTAQTGFARSGNVRLNSKGEIVGFREKRAFDDGTTPDAPGNLINGGVYLLRRGLFDLIAPGTRISIEKEIFPLLTDGRLRGFVTDGYFIDIGVPADYERAQRELPERLRYDHKS